MKAYTYFFAVLMFVLASSFDLVSTYSMTVEEKVHRILTKAEEYSKKQGKHEIALKLCNKAIKLLPRNLESYYRRAFVFGRKGDYVNAIKDFSFVIKHDKKRKFTKARKFRADCYMGLGYMQNAVHDYSVMLKRDPKSDGSGKIWFYMAEALALMNKNNLAIKAIQNGCATGSHWCEKMLILQKKILMGEKIVPHRPLSN